MVLICRRSSSASKYKFDFRSIKDSGATLSDVIDLLKGVKNPRASYLTPMFDRTYLKNKLLTFSDESIENVLSKLLARRNFALNARKEIAQGIVAPQDSVNNDARKVLGDSFGVRDGIFVISNAEKEGLRLTRAELELIRPYYTTNELLKYYGRKQNSSWVIYTDSSFKKPSSIKP